MLCSPSHQKVESIPPTSHLSWICDSFWPQAYGGSGVLSLRSLRRKRSRTLPFSRDPPALSGPSRHENKPWLTCPRMRERVGLGQGHPRPAVGQPFSKYMMAPNRDRRNHLRNPPLITNAQGCPADRGTSHVNGRLLSTNKCLLF